MPETGVTLTATSATITAFRGTPEDEEYLTADFQSDFKHD